VDENTDQSDGQEESKSIAPRRVPGALGKTWKQRPKLLRNLQWVVRNPTSEKATEFQQSLQKLLREDPGKFVDRLMRAEREYEASQRKDTATAGPAAPGASSTSGGAAPDPGSARIQALIAELRARLKPFSANP
jgi:hypothetical protein